MQAHFTVRTWVSVFWTSVQSVTVRLARYVPFAV